MTNRKGFPKSHSRSPKPQDSSETVEKTIFGTKSLLFCSSLLIVVLSVGAHYYQHYFIYLPSRISQKADLPLVYPNNTDYATWGTYRPHMYFGLRTHHPESPLFGMIWYEQVGMTEEGMKKPRIRHWCEQGNGIVKFSWTEADGKTFGRQTINDDPLVIETDWVNSNRSWSTRVKLSSEEESKKYAFIFYFIIQDKETLITPDYQANKRLTFSGSSQLFGNFAFNIETTKKNFKHSYYEKRMMPYPDASSILEILLSSLLYDRSDNLLRLPSEFLSDHPETKPNIIAFQLNISPNATIRINFSADDEFISEERFDILLNQRSKEFYEKFENAYELAGKGYAGFYMELAKTALSNMLGSISYSFGYNKVMSKYSHSPISYGPHSLLTTCPSRTTFPRGFLWDEGFHHLLFRKFDPDLSLQIISSWLDTMNIDGWIPREMILDAEAEKRVPSEFIVQHDYVANPPMFFYLIERFLDDEKFMQTHKESIEKLYPRLKLWFTWLNKTQIGPLPGTYRWRGRNSTTDIELNPKTLSSGLDDYPRATHPSDGEYHLDLRCWMALSARVLARLSILTGDSDGEKLFVENYNFLSDFSLLNQLHWSNRVNRYCDYGLHSDSVVLKRIIDKNQAANMQQLGVVKRFTKSSPKLGFVEDAFGYVSLFPLMLKLIPHDSDILRTVIQSIRSEQELWTNFGLRSLSPSSSYYNAHNTEHDPPYWRGAVWLNMNYMVLTALKHYSFLSGPNQELAFKVYSELRNIIVTNVAKEFKRTGYFWENYDDTIGRGQGSHPFTGWTSLVLSIMSEQYD